MWIERLVTTIPDGCRLAVAILCLCSTQCQDSPRDGSSIANPTKPLTFTGYALHRNAEIRFRALDVVATDARRVRGATQPEVWRQFARTVGKGSPHDVDITERAWYAWEASVQLPLDRAFWNVEGSGKRRSMSIEVQSLVPGPSRGDLRAYTFRADADRCLQRVGDEYSRGRVGGLEFAMRCSTGLSTTLSVPCGARSQACCIDASLTRDEKCDAGLVCDAGNVCSVRAKPDARARASRDTPCSRLGSRSDRCSADGRVVSVR